MLVSGSILMWKKGSICISLPCRSNFIWAMLKFPGWWLVAVFRTTSRLGRVLWTVLIFSGSTFSHARWENRLSAAQANMCFWSFWQSIWDSHSYDFLCSKWNISMVPYGSRSLHRVFAPRNFRASELRFDAARWASLRMRAATTWKPWPWRPCPQPRRCWGCWWLRAWELCSFCLTQETSKFWGVLCFKMNTGYSITW
jgi:hypothetical protein